MVGEIAALFAHKLIVELAVGDIVAAMVGTERHLPAGPRVLLVRLVLLPGERVEDMGCLVCVAALLALGVQR